MKAADIPDKDFLRAVDTVQRAQAERFTGLSELPWACWGSHDFDDGFRAEYGPFVLDHFPDVPEKVLRAKGQRLINRGLMTGCMCGCRGDMELTDAGRELLSGSSNKEKR